MKDVKTKLRDKCDKLLTPIIKLLYPRCECCGQPTQVAHHWIEKSRSSFLRYDLRNLIALCNSCHTAIHNRFGNSVMGSFDRASLIIEQRGVKWKEQLDKDMHKEVKTDLDFYQHNFERLNDIYNQLKQSKNL